MKTANATCALLAGALFLSGCQTVKYPGAADETPPTGVELTLQTAPGGKADATSDNHRLHATMRRAGGGVATLSTEMIAADDVILIRAQAQDEESGIKEIRVTGAKRVCEEDPRGGAPRPTDYQLPQVWLLKDFAPTGKGQIPKQASLETKISAAVLTGASRRNGAAVAGQNASFQFYLEATNGAGKKSATQWLEYRIGKTRCP